MSECFAMVPLVVSDMLRGLDCRFSGFSGLLADCGCGAGFFATDEGVESESDGLCDEGGFF